MSLHQVRRGSGEPLVLVHGIGSQWRIWEPVLDALAADFDVIALDLPGFGRTPHDGTGPTVTDQAQRVAAFCTELGLERPHVAGNSMGGGIVLELARMGAVASATAVSPVGFWTGRELAFAQRSLRVSLARSCGRCAPPCPPSWPTRPPAPPCSASSSPARGAWTARPPWTT